MINGTTFIPWEHLHERKDDLGWENAHTPQGLHVTRQVWLQCGGAQVFIRPWVSCAQPFEMWLSHWGGSFLWVKSIFLFFEPGLPQDLLDLQYEVELMYNARVGSGRAYSLSLWQLESISWDLNIEAALDEVCHVEKFSVVPVPDELACSQAPPDQCHCTCEPRWDRGITQGEMQYITSCL